MVYQSPKNFVLHPKQTDKPPELGSAFLGPQPSSWREAPEWIDTLGFGLIFLGKPKILWQFPASSLAALIQQLKGCQVLPPNTQSSCLKQLILVRLEKEGASLKRKKQCLGKLKWPETEVDFSSKRSYPNTLTLPSGPFHRTDFELPYQESPNDPHRGVPKRGDHLRGQRHCGEQVEGVPAQAPGVHSARQVVLVEAGALAFFFVFAKPKAKPSSQQQKKWPNKPNKAKRANSNQQKTETKPTN